MHERLYIPPEKLSSRVVLRGDDARYLLAVKRCRLGEVVELFTGDGYVHRGRVSELARGRLTLTVEASEPGRRESPVRVSVATAVPRGKRMDTMVEKLSELGVRKLQPVDTARSVVRATTVSAARYQHWRRIAVEAARQCGRATVMEVAPGQALLSAAQSLADSALKFVATPEGAQPLLTTLAPLAPGDTAVFIGPEGDFQQEELSELVAAGAVPVSLGPTVLRVETAAVVAAAAVMLWADSRRS